MPTLALAFACRLLIVLDTEPGGDEPYPSSEEFLAKPSTAPALLLRIALGVGCPFQPMSHGQ